MTTYKATLFEASSELVTSYFFGHTEAENDKITDKAEREQFHAGQLSEQRVIELAYFIANSNDNYSIRDFGYNPD